MKKRLKVVTLSLIAFILTTSSAFAEDVTWQKNNAAILNNNSIIDDALRWIAFNITKFFCMLADVCETLWDKTFGFIDLTNYEEVNAIIVQLKPVLVAVTCLCLIALGIMYIVKQEKKPLFQNIILGILAVSCSTFIFTTANSLVTSFKDGIINTGANTESYQLVNDNLIDLVAIDKTGSISSLNYNAGTGIKHNAGIYTKADLKELDFNETLNWSDKSKGQDIYGWSDTFNNYMRYRAVKVDGTYKAVENYNGLLTSDFGNEFYYRYSFDFWSCILQLFAFVLIFLALSYKNMRIAYELVVSRIMAFMYAADIGNGERLKQILFFIRDTYITLCVSVLCIKLYEVANAAITSFGINGFAKGIVSVFIAFVVIDGPNLVERILGMDAGISSSLGRTMAIFGMARTGAKMAAGAAKGAGNMGMSAATGKTAAQRKAESGYASMSEKVGIKANKVATSSSGKNGSETVMDEKPDKEKTSGYHDSDDVMNSNESNSVKNASGINTSTGSGYDTSVMDTPDDKESGSEAVMHEKPDKKSAFSYPNAADVMNSNESNSVENTSGINTSTGSGYDTSVIDVPNIGENGHSFNMSDVSSGSEDVTSNTIMSNESPVNSESAKPMRFRNPVFSQAVKELAPDKNASIGEKKDFNRQVNNIVRGDHKAIKPDKNAKADYKFKNYEKALELEKAYKSVPKGERKKEGEEK